MSIARGDDGGLWLAFNGGMPLARMSAGGAVTLYQPESARLANTVGNGPDGRIWFATELRRIGSLSFEPAPPPRRRVASPR